MSFCCCGPALDPSVGPHRTLPGPCGSPVDPYCHPAAAATAVLLLLLLLLPSLPLLLHPSTAVDPGACYPLQRSVLDCPGAYYPLTADGPGAYYPPQRLVSLLVCWNWYKMIVGPPGIRKEWMGEDGGRR